MCAKYGSQLSRLVPELVGVHPSSEQPYAPLDNDDPYPLYEAVLGWLTFIADAGPVLLLLDDLQWASQATLAVVQHLVVASACSPEC